MIESILGNADILQQHKTAFLCSRRIPASVVLKCYDWATMQRKQGRCVIGGFHSRLEQDVLHFLLKGSQPVILALARGMKQRFPAEIRAAIDAGQLLIVSPFPDTVTRVTRDTAEQRNRFMLELADEVVVGFASPGGMVERLLAGVEDKLVTRIDSSKII